MKILGTILFNEDFPPYVLCPSGVDGKSILSFQNSTLIKKFCYLEHGGRFPLVEQNFCQIIIANKKVAIEITQE